MLDFILTLSPWLRVRAARQSLQPLLNFLDARFRGGGPRGDAYSPCSFEPLLTQARRSLHMMHPSAVTTACLYQFVRVVAVRAANDNDHIGLPRQFNGR